MTKRSSVKWYVWPLSILLISTLFFAESMAVHHLFTSRFPGAYDFYAPWAGARALLLEGRNPYSMDVTSEIQIAKDIDPTLRDKGKGGFAYPLHVIFSFWPLVHLPYTWAQAIWMVMLQWVSVATVVILLRLIQWAPTPLELAGLFLGILSLYPISRSIMLGQFTLHVTLFLGIALLALRDNHDIIAGAALALTSIKPQMVILVVPWILLWAISRCRWRLLWGLLSCSATLLLGSLILFPYWPISFVKSVMRYSAVAGGRWPIVILTRLLGLNASTIVNYFIATTLIAIMLITWRRGLGSTESEFTRATNWTIIVSSLVLFQTGTTNQAILIIPFFTWLWKAKKRWARWQVLIVSGGLLAFPWIVFFLSTYGQNGPNENMDASAPIMFLVLPFISLVILIGIELSNSRWLRHSERPTSPGKTR
jgi:hypothetical protein